MCPIDRFESALRAVLPEMAGDRSFVCDGSPLDCTVFIVGCNPATDTRTEFWHYWRTRATASTRRAGTPITERLGWPLATERSATLDARSTS
jgi:hypothetical protein